MKTVFKTLSFCAAALFVFTFSEPCYAFSNSFTDLAEVGAKDKILALQEKGYVKGINDGEFAPAKPITAAESVQLIVRALELNIDNVRFLKEPQATDYFPPADNAAWYADALIIASVNGLDLPAEMDPNQEWARQEFTYHLVQALEKHAGLPMINLVPVEISDQDQMEISYSGAIQRALAYDIVQLDTAGNFGPRIKISRAEAAEQIYNALAYLKAHPAPVKN